MQIAADSNRVCMYLLCVYGRV